MADPQLQGPERAQNLQAVLSGASLDDLQLLQDVITRKSKSVPKVDPQEVLTRDWRDGGYPYHNLMRRSTYEAQKYQLQVELLKLQAWVKETGQRVVALEKPSDVEKDQWYFQRYVLHKLPYTNKELEQIGKLDPLILGRAHVVYERGEKPGALL